MNTDRVLIVGGGPVGLTTALLLAQRGVPVTVLERTPEVQKDYRASTFHAATLDLLAESGISKALVDMGIKCPIVQYRGWQEGKVAEFDHELLKNETDHPYRLQCEQFKLSGWLYDTLAKTAGVELLYGHDVIDIKVGEDSVELKAMGPDGEKVLKGKYLVGADGGRGMVRPALDIEFTGFTYPERILVIGTSLDFRSLFPEIANVNYVSDPVNYSHILRIPDMWRMSMPLHGDITDDEAKTDENINKRLHAVMPDVTLPDIRVRAVYHVHQRVAETYRKGRAFLAGDAAHLNNPKGGMGLNGGLHDAYSLADRMAKAWHNKSAEGELDGYEAQRRPEAINAIHKQTQQNYKNLQESDPAEREKLFSQWRRMAADPKLAYEHLMLASMLVSLRRAGMLPVKAAV